MKCPYCHTDYDKVVDTRSSEDGFAIRRRRECLKCGRRTTTYERYVEPTLMVMKRSGASVPYSREKVKRGLERACWKRPISKEQIEAVIANIEDDIYSSFENQVESKEIGKVVLEHLRELDLVAFVRFASVYRKFESINDFVDILRPMLQVEDESQ